MALERSKHEGIDKSERLKEVGGPFYNNLQKWALFKCAYYLCHTCKNPYFGGMIDCR